MYGQELRLGMSGSNSGRGGANNGVRLVVAMVGGDDNDNRCSYGVDNNKWCMYTCGANSEVCWLEV